MKLKNSFVYLLWWTKLLPLLMLLYLCSCGTKESPSLSKIQGYTMGTSYMIKFINEPKNDIHKIKKAIDQTLLDFDQELSNWNPNSWVQKFNQHHSIEAIPLPKHAEKVISLCLELHKKSNGAFDITLSPLIELWGFGSKREFQVPTREKINSIRSKMGSQFLKLDFKKHTIQKLVPELQINCSALAKGYGVDLIAGLLEKEFKVQTYMVEIGGEVFVKGNPPHQKHWTLGVTKPSFNNQPQSLQDIVKLQGGALATSGDYQNYFKHENKYYSHVLNPKSGYPIEHQTCSVSIIADSCALADGLATTCLVLGVEGSKSFLRQYPKVKAWIMERKKGGLSTLEHYRIQGFPPATK